MATANKWACSPEVLKTKLSFIGASGANSAQVNSIVGEKIIYKMSEKIPAEAVLNTYQRVEDSLHFVLKLFRTVITIKKSGQIIFVTVIFKTCSFLDSLFY